MGIHFSHEALEWLLFQTEGLDQVVCQVKDVSEVSRSKAGRFFVLVANEDDPRNHTIARCHNSKYTQNLSVCLAVVSKRTNAFVVAAGHHF